MFHFNFCNIILFRFEYKIFMSFNFICIETAHNLVRHNLKNWFFTAFYWLISNYLVCFWNCNWKLAKKTSTTASALQKTKTRRRKKKKQIPARTENLEFFFRIFWFFALNLIWSVIIEWYVNQSPPWTNFNIIVYFLLPNFETFLKYPVIQYREYNSHKSAKEENEFNRQVEGSANFFRPQKKSSIHFALEQLCVWVQFSTRKIYCEKKKYK